MKKLLLLCIFCASSIAINAQTQLTTYGWEQWGIYTSVPVGANINQNTENVFEVESDQFFIRLELFDTNGAGIDELSEILLEGATNAGIDAPSQISHFSPNGNEIAYVTGRDSANNAVLFGLVFGGTEDSFIKYTVVCDSSNWKTAVDMIKSVKMR
ncbi:amidohydrolase family protein [Moheibacter sediminis]|uniref:Dihydro-orotase-like n=1 Tax=Moheibacter sediminis TaxID=1434700 RepID=A0A1W1ZX21_9FLAO|nr:hypothetical protein [Moheibacter sediminis]SMC52954.1 Dihydro-orotase-like [Moheibacter sediminis]